jgi:hypothetical protein
VVFVKSENVDVFVPPDEFNVKLCGPIYDPETDSILERVKEAFENKDYRTKLDKLVEHSFYFNDGHAADRACSFIVDTLSAKGLINREKMLKKYSKIFTYMDNYK